MITLRPADERGHANLGWLDSRHTFSFSNYHDPRYMGFRALRVINQDRVLGGHGFPMHSHREMEIISYVVEGKLEHADTMDHRSVIGPGGVQVLSGGTGMAHSEYNPSPTDLVHFLQIWIQPDESQRGQTPHYDQRSFSREEREGTLRLITSGDGRDGSAQIRHDTDLYATVLGPGSEVVHSLRPGRHAWVHVARGNVLLNGQLLGPGDGAALTEEREIRLVGKDEAEVLVFDLP
jgi:quercetin 2,3-dioxygenase